MSLCFVCRSETFMRKCETFLELFKKIIQVKGAIYSDFEVKFK